MECLWTQTRPQFIVLIWKCRAASLEHLASSAWQGDIWSGQTCHCHRSALLGASKYCWNLTSTSAAVTLAQTGVLTCHLIRPCRMIVRLPCVCDAGKVVRFRVPFSSFMFCDDGLNCCVTISVLFVVQELHCYISIKKKVLSVLDIHGESTCLEDVLSLSISSNQMCVDEYCESENHQERIHDNLFFFISFEIVFFPHSLLWNTCRLS